MRLVSLTNLKLFLEKVDTNHDSLLRIIIEQVSASIEAFLNRYLLKAARTVNRNAGHRYYYLPAYPIDEAEPLTVVVNGVTQAKNSSYYVRAEDGLIEFHKLSIPIYDDPNDVVITWTGGYVASGESDTECLNVPSLIQDAALRQCAYNFRRRKDIGVATVSMPDGSINKNPPWLGRGVKPSLDEFLLPEVKGLLKKYRRPPGEY